MFFDLRPTTYINRYLCMLPSAEGILNWNRYFVLNNPCLHA